MSTEPQPTSAKRSIATFDNYEDAQDAVDRLSDAGFPVERVTIVGRDMQYVEQVTGRLTTARAALMGAAQGAVIGFIFSLLVGLIFTIDPNPAWLLLLAYGLASGAILGAILGAALHLMTGGRRDFASVAGMVAQRYEVMVDGDIADRAMETLAQPDTDRQRDRARLGGRVRPGGSRTGPRM
jgi:hypothetical protein